MKKVAVGKKRAVVEEVAVGDADKREVDESEELLRLCEGNSFIILY